LHDCACTKNGLSISSVEIILLPLNFILYYILRVVLWQITLNNPVVNFVVRGKRIRIIVCILYIAQRP
jgi:hypothetical protein